MPQFSKVNTQHGAPQGRRSYGTLPQPWPRTVRLFKVNLDSGGYDDGGAYWGLRPGLQALYCATDGADYQQFTDASSRLDAALLLNIPGDYLMAAPKKQAERFLKATEGKDDTSANMQKAIQIRKLGYAK